MSAMPSRTTVPTQQAAASIHGVDHTQVNFAMPTLACDCHTHVFGPAAHYPWAEGRTYTPGDASIESLLALQQVLGLGRVVIVHPSPYGSDNACTVDAVHALGARARGVAVIDDATTEAGLRAMHAAGVRGVRLNLETGDVNDTVYAATELERIAAQVAPLGWHVQLYSNLAVVGALAPVIRALPCPLVVDHFCKVQANLGTEQPHFDTLLDLVRAGRVWVKLSAPHRIASDPDSADVTAIARALMAANPARMLWGSDWPHPGARPGVPRRADAIEAFNPIDDGRALNRLAHWAQGDAALLQRILVDNPAALYDFER